MVDLRRRDFKQRRKLNEPINLKEEVHSAREGDDGGGALPKSLEALPTRIKVRCKDGQCGD